MLRSTFPNGQNPRITYPLDGFYEGFYHINAKKRSQGENERNDEKDAGHHCVIVDYKVDEHPTRQLMLSSRMEYALKVLHIEKEESTVKVIYPSFDKTMSQWLSDALPPEDMQWGEWMKTEVMPKIRELWKLLHEMKERKIQICNKSNHDPNGTGNERNHDPDSTGDHMPLIRKESKFLKLRDGEFVSSEEVMLLPRLLNLQEGDDHDKNLHYACHVFNTVLSKDQADDLPPKFISALNFWDNEISSSSEEKDGITSLNYWLCSKHPILYDPADKKNFLLLIHDVMFRSGLKGWLNGQFHWMWFLDQIKKIKGKNKNAYKGILQFGAGQSEHLSYSEGSDIVKFTRNALMHFEENYKKGSDDTTWHPLLDGEVVEILDDELDVCSIHYGIARTIIAEDPPEKYMEEGWKKYQANEWKKLKEEAQGAKVISEAYQPVQPKVMSKVGDVFSWVEVEEIYRKRRMQLWVEGGTTRMERGTYWIAAADILKQSRLCTKMKEGLKPCWMELEAIENKKMQPLEFHMKENSVVVWKELEKDKIKANEELKLDTKLGWKRVEEIIKADQPPSLKVRKGQDKPYWMEAFEAHRPAAELLT
ncbi:hypothetical protein SLEP1_g7096 [Rubroshorea leprosula]|nr:hypothetical protein SLEP1_g7096 [Rubroshorea leprosula]